MHAVVKPTRVVAVEVFVGGVDYGKALRPTAAVGFHVAVRCEGWLPPCAVRIDDIGTACCEAFVQPIFAAADHVLNTLTAFARRVGGANVATLSAVVVVGGCVHAFGSA